MRVLRPLAGRERARTAYDLYVRASQLDEDPSTMDEAEALYRRALELDPWLAIAYTNLGNIRFRRGDEPRRRGALPQGALEIDARQPEAQYNLGYVMLERGDAARAIAFFAAPSRATRVRRRVLQPRDGLRAARRHPKARPCWKKYLELEPTGTWAEIARKHL